MIAPILARRDAAGFWLAVVLTGLGTGLGAALTLVARTIEPRSIYDARLSGAEVLERQRERDGAPA